MGPHEVVTCRQREVLANRQGCGHRHRSAQENRAVADGPSCGCARAAATAPARQPRAYEPIARAASGAGPGAAPKSSFAGGSLAGGSLTEVSSADGSFDVVLLCCVLAARGGGGGPPLLVRLGRQQ